MLLGPYVSGAELILNGNFAGSTIDGWATTATFAGSGSVAVVAN